MTAWKKKALAILGGWLYIIAVGLWAYHLDYYGWKFTISLFLMALLITAAVIKTPPPRAEEPAQEDVKEDIHTEESKNSDNSEKQTP